MNVPMDVARVRLVVGAGVKADVGTGAKLFIGYYKNFIMVHI